MSSIGSSGNLPQYRYQPPLNAAQMEDAAMDDEGCELTVAESGEAGVEQSDESSEKDDSSHDDGKGVKVDLCG